MRRSNERGSGARNSGTGVRAGKIIRIGAGILAASATLYFLSSGHILSRLVDSKTPAPIGANDTGRRIEIGVLNGSGVPGIAVKMTGHLRRLGYDVVELGNYETNALERSIIIDWVNDTTAAKKIAAAVDLQRNRIVRRKGTNDLVDFSVILGKDYAKLIPLRNGVPTPLDR